MQKKPRLVPVAANQTSIALTSGMAQNGATSQGWYKAIAAPCTSLTEKLSSRHVAYSHACKLHIQALCTIHFAFVFMYAYLRCYTCGIHTHGA